MRVIYLIPIVLAQERLSYSGFDDQRHEHVAERNANGVRLYESLILQIIPNK